MGIPKTEVGWAMWQNQANAALLIIAALEKTGWLVKPAATLLGFRDRRQLSVYIRQLGLLKIKREQRCPWRKKWRSLHGDP